MHFRSFAILLLSILLSLAACQTDTESAAKSKANSSTATATSADKAAKNEKVLQEAQRRKEAGETSTGRDRARGKNAVAGREMTEEQKQQVVKRAGNVAKNYCGCKNKPEASQKKCYQKYRTHHANIFGSLKKKDADLATRFDEAYQKELAGCK